MVPSLAVQQAGLGVATADNMNTWVQGGCLLANLQAFVGVSNMTVYMIGYVAAGDGGQGYFYWNSTTPSSSNNNTTIIAPYASIQGAWVRIQNTNVGTNAFRYVLLGSSDTATTADYTIAWKSASGVAKSQAIPAASAVPMGNILIIKDAYGDSAINPITITPSSGTIDISATAVIAAKYNSLTLQSDGVSNWVVI
jgi:hypothetical protein